MYHTNNPDIKLKQIYLLHSSIKLLEIALSQTLTSDGPVSGWCSKVEGACILLEKLNNLTPVSQSDRNPS